jgi:hypothetical protein
MEKLRSIAFLLLASGKYAVSFKPLDVSAAIYRRGKRSFFYPMDTSRNGCSDREKYEYPCRQAHNLLTVITMNSFVV